MAVKSDVLRKAKEVKNDEFYTQLDDIVKEIAQHKDYVRHFQGKTVLCNCDDPEWSSFVEFFRKFFKKLGLKKMICTHYEKDGSPSYKLEWSGEKINGDTVNMIKTPLKGNGDFRSGECIELLKEADIVVTNAREVFGLTTRNRINKGFPGHTPLFLCPEIRAVRHRMAA